MTTSEVGVETFGWRRAGRRVGAVVVLLGAIAAPGRDAGATPDQEPPTPAQQQQAEVAAKRGEVAVEVNFLEAQNSEVQAALATIETNVITQQAEYDAAAGTAETAAADLTAAETALTQAQANVDALNMASDNLMVEAYVSPPSERSIDTLSAESMSDAMVMHAVIQMQADEDAGILELLETARDQLVVERENRSIAATAAEDARVAAETELGEASAAREQQVAAVEAAQLALDHKLVEAENLATLDSQLSAQIAAEQAERARQLEEARLAAEAAAAAANAPPPSGGDGGGVVPLEGGLASVSCHTGGAITVAASLAPDLQRLLDDANADGLALCGGGFRDPQRQIELREAHCGSGYYNIYQKPASQCNPPTARPGTSMHEQGLAVDFANCSTRSTACYKWLAGHASDYGLYNLPSEAWHWSVNGN